MGPTGGWRLWPQAIILLRGGLDCLHYSSTSNAQRIRLTLLAWRGSGGGQGWRQTSANGAQRKPTCRVYSRRGVPCGVCACAIVVCVCDCCVCVRAAKGSKEPKEAEQLSLFAGGRGLLPVRACENRTMPRLDRFGWAVLAVSFNLGPMTCGQRCHCLHVRVTTLVPVGFCMGILPAEEMRVVTVASWEEPYVA